MEEFPSFGVRDQTLCDDMRLLDRGINHTQGIDLFNDMRKGIARYWFHSFAFLRPGTEARLRVSRSENSFAHLEDDVEGAAAASAAALAKPCSASIGAFIAARGSVSSNSSSEDGAVLGTIPYVAYLWGWGCDRWVRAVRNE